MWEPSQIRFQLQSLLGALRDSSFPKPPAVADRPHPFATAPQSGNGSGKSSDNRNASNVHAIASGSGNATAPSETNSSGAAQQSQVNMIAAASCISSESYKDLQVHHPVENVYKAISEADLTVMDVSDNNDSDRRHLYQCVTDYTDNVDWDCLLRSNLYGGTSPEHVPTCASPVGHDFSTSQVSRTRDS